MKKINMLRVAIYIFWTSFIFIIAFCVLSYFVKINQSISVNGFFHQNNNNTVYTFNVLDSNSGIINVGGKVVLVDHESKFSVEGEILNKDMIDMGLAEGEIAQYKVQILGSMPAYEDRKYYKCSVYTEKKNKLLSIFFNEVIGY